MGQSLRSSTAFYPWHSFLRIGGRRTKDQDSSWLQRNCGLALTALMTVTVKFVLGTGVGVHLCLRTLWQLPHYPNAFERLPCLASQISQFTWPWKRASHCIEKWGTIQKGLKFCLNLTPPPPLPRFTCNQITHREEATSKYIDHTYWSADHSGAEAMLGLILL